MRTIKTYKKLIKKKFKTINDDALKHYMKEVWEIDLDLNSKINKTEMAFNILTNIKVSVTNYGLLIEYPEDEIIFYKLHFVKFDEKCEDRILHLFHRGLID